GRVLLQRGGRPPWGGEGGVCWARSRRKRGRGAPPRGAPAGERAPAALATILLLLHHFVQHLDPPDQRLQLLHLSRWWGPDGGCSWAQKRALSAASDGSVLVRARRLLAEAAMRAGLTLLTRCPDS